MNTIAIDNFIKENEMIQSMIKTRSFNVIEYWCIDVNHEETFYVRSHTSDIDATTIWLAFDFMSRNLFDIRRIDSKQFFDEVRSFVDLSHSFKVLHQVKTFKGDGIIG